VSKLAPNDIWDDNACKNDIRTADTLIPKMPWMKKKNELWSYYCLGTSFSSQWEKSKTIVGSSCLVPLKLEKCFCMNS